MRIHPSDQRHLSVVVIYSWSSVLSISPRFVWAYMYYTYSRNVACNLYKLKDFQCRIQYNISNIPSLCWIFSKENRNLQAFCTCSHSFHLHYCSRLYVFPLDACCFAAFFLLFLMYIIVAQKELTRRGRESFLECRRGRIWFMKQRVKIVLHSRLTVSCLCMHALVQFNVIYVGRVCSSCLVA